MKKNRITELLGITYPLIEGGMAYIGDGRLAAAVSNAGGFGQVAVSGRTPENFEKEIELAASLTSKPFGVNIPISGYFTHNVYFDIIEKHRDSIKAVSLASGDPRAYIPYFKSLGLRVLVLVGTVKHAINAEKAGADVVICEGFEAGGRNSPYELTLFTLVPQVSRAVSIPVVAAGGIATGTGIYAAMSLGAEGVQMGTRFIATLECPASEQYKNLLVDSKDHSTCVLERSVGRVNRVIQSPYTDHVLRVEKENITPEALYPYISGRRNKIAAVDGKLAEGWVHAGQSVGMIQSIKPVSAVIEELLKEVEVASSATQKNLQSAFPLGTESEKIR